MRRSVAPSLFVVDLLRLVPHLSFWGSLRRSSSSPPPSPPPPFLPPLCPRGSRWGADSEESGRTVQAAHGSRPFRQRLGTRRRARTRRGRSSARGGRRMGGRRGSAGCFSMQCRPPMLHSACTPCAWLASAACARGIQVSRIRNGLVSISQEGGRHRQFPWPLPPHLRAAMA